MRPPRDWSALETPNYAQERNHRGGASHLPNVSVSVVCLFIVAEDYSDLGIFAETSVITGILQKELICAFISATDTQDII